MSRINEKINEIQKYLDELKEAAPNTLEEYESNKIVRAACERYFERVAEAVTDLAFIIITKKNLEFLKMI
ncbi:MAG: HepT-like ribonuclease domain-containing protein [Nanoarchaeota archaeon]